MIIRLLLVLTLLAGCSAATPTKVIEPDVELASALRPFDDCAALTERVRDHLLAQVGPDGLLPPGGGIVGRDGSARAAAEGGVTLDGVAEGGAAAPQAPAAAANDSAAPAAGVSGTNVQEAGIDEADVAKTDGRWLYTVVDGTLRVIDVRGDEPALVATRQLGAGVARDMLLVDDRVLIMGDAPVQVPGPKRLPQPEQPLAVPAPPAANDLEMLVPWNPRTRLWLIDVGTPSRPQVVSTMTLDGSLVSTRLTGDIARVVVRSGLTAPGLVVPSGGHPDGQRRALEINRERVRSSAATDWLPRVEVDGAGSETLVDCDAVHAPAEFGDAGLVTLLSLDTQAPELTPDRTQAVLGAAETVYATDEHLYVTTSRWPWVMPGAPRPVDPLASVPDAPPPPAETLPVPAEPDASVEALPKPVEPRQPNPPVESLTPDAPVETLPLPVEPSAEPAPLPVEPSAEPLPPRDLPQITTEIHRFDLDGGEATYAASGSVPGRLLNQWALSEHAGDLRIATTEDGTVAAQRSHSAVRVLREDGGRLREIGHVGDLGRGEQIYAVRYAGDLGFVVTFRQVDPLYTIDLSDPTAPRVLGKLKIPGYSAYLHPLDENHILGVGQDADEDGRTTGVQVSLFDVTDLGDPQRVGQLALGEGTMTTVEFDHRAFLHWPAEQMVVLPVEAWQRGEAGALVLTVDPDGGVRRRGFVQHTSRDGMPAPVQRAFVVGDRLVTISLGSVLISDLGTLEPLGEASITG